MATPNVAEKRRPKSPGANRKKVVVIGGGTGSFHVLSGLKKYPVDLTAVVTMTDSGGSSGRLRDEFGVLPPGDVRQCLLALSPDDHAGKTLRELFNYRFKKGNGLDGHSFGNLFLTVLTELMGSTDKAIDEMGILLGVKGCVLPVTLTNTNLCARLRNGKIIVGETHLDHRRVDPDVPIEDVYLQDDAKIFPKTAKAIAEADAIVIGPGDLYTSVIPNLLVTGVAEAVRRSKAKKIYVCNLMTKHGESDGYKASDFIMAIEKYLGGRKTLDYALVNTAAMPKQLRERYAAEGSLPVPYDPKASKKLVGTVLAKPLLTGAKLVRHDSDALASTIVGLL